MTDEWHRCNETLCSTEREVQRLREALEGMVSQFAYKASKDGLPAITTGGLSALEDAFDVLGYNDPHPTPERKCQAPDCTQHATCGTPTVDGGYWQCCFEHFQEQQQALAARTGEGQDATSL